MIGADVLLKSLENQGVTEIFSYPGGTVIPIFDRMPSSNIRRILVRNEQAAAFAAAGVSRATQKVGVCLATSGPGATNLITGIADAKLDSVPMVALTGNVFRSLIGSDAFQEVDIVGICEPIVKHAYFVEKVEDLPRIVAEAFHLAKSGRPGPVLIDIPKCIQSVEISDVMEKALSEKKEIEMHLPGYFHEMNVDFSEIEKAVNLINKAKKPVVIFGHGVVLSNAEKGLTEFLEKSKIPFVWTLHGIGAYEGESDLSLGMLGMHGTASANYAVHNADLIVGIGIRFDDRITGVLADFQKGKKIIHFDIDPSEFDKNVYAEVKICGQIKETLPQITEKISEKISEKFEDWQKILLDKKNSWKLDGKKENVLTEISVIEALYKKIDKEDIVVSDVGQHEMWLAQRFQGKSRKFLASGGLGTMGFSLPTAMGATFSGHSVWSISGDGGIQMNIQELMTVVQDKLPVKILIINNGFLGMVRQWQDLFYDKNYVDTPLANPDFQKIGEAYGIPSFRAETLDETIEVLEKMKDYNDGPILCEFVVKKEENVFPMVPAGKNLGETLLSKNEKI